MLITFLSVEFRHFFHYTSLPREIREKHNHRAALRIGTPWYNEPNRQLAEV
ncbi:hypothetical protein [Geobacter sp.]|uniref:hypothetical protein n=1 Tax=Geobacter sp. TaxID=46610 RepID=UPI00263444ED|nr:hypothetical protein [Geobacter sp.]